MFNPCTKFMQIWDLDYLLQGTGNSRREADSENIDTDEMDVETDPSNIDEGILCSFCYYSIPTISYYLITIVCAQGSRGKIQAKLKLLIIQAVSSQTYKMMDYNSTPRFHGLL